MSDTCPHDEIDARIEIAYVAATIHFKRPMKYEEDPPKSGAHLSFAGRPPGRARRARFAAMRASQPSLFSTTCIAAGVATCSVQR
jgi:hypothetical protein